MEHLGVHWTSDLYGCDADALDDVARIESYMLEAARVANATVISSQFHKFAPQGVSGVVVIAESHLAIHTWPERGYAALDVFTCGDTIQAEEGFRWLANRFHATRMESNRQVRGDVRRIETFHARPTYQPLHPELFRYDEAFVRRFIAVSEPRELAEQIHLFQLFTPEFCRLIIEECEHHGGWVTVLDHVDAAHSAHNGVVDVYEPDTTLSWEALPGLEAVYAAVLQNHVRPIMEAIWTTWKLQKWDPPALRRYEPGVVAAMGLHHDAESVAMVGYLNDAFEGGGTGFPRWNLTVGDARTVSVGSVVVFPGGVSHEHLAHPVTAGRRYTLANSFY